MAISDTSKQKRKIQATITFSSHLKLENATSKIQHLGLFQPKNKPPDCASNARSASAQLANRHVVPSSTAGDLSTYRQW